MNKIICILVFSQLVLANSQNEVDLRLNLPEGFSASITITSEFNSLNKKVPGLNKDVEDYNKTIEEFQIHCLSVDSDGIMEIEQTWKSRKEVFRDSSGKICIRYDTEDPLHPLPESEVFYNNIIGRSMIFRVNQKGEILEIMGYEKIARKMARPAIKYLHLGKDGVIKRLKNMGLVSISEFCSAGPLRMGELHVETAIPDKQTIPKTVSFSKKWSLREINDKLAHYEIMTNSVKKQTREILDFGGKRTGKLYNEESGVRHIYCNVTTGLVMKSQHDINSSSRDIHIDYDQPETVREYSSNGSITTETVVNEVQLREGISVVSLSLLFFGVFVFLRACLVYSD